MLWDDNHISIDGDTALSVSEDMLARFRAYGWAVRRVDGHDHEARGRGADRGTRSRKPTLIACRTIIGFSAPKKAGTAASHGAPAGRRGGGEPPRRRWVGPPPPSRCRTTLREQWEAAGRRGGGPRRSWLKRLARHPQRAEFERAMAGKLPESWARGALTALTRGSRRPRSPRSRPASPRSRRWTALVPAVPEMVGGSADLTGSNNTNVKGVPAITPGNLRRPLRPLGHARAWHGGRHERHGAAWRRHPLFRHLPGLRRLPAPRVALGGADETSG